MDEQKTKTTYASKFSSSFKTSKVCLDVRLLLKSTAQAKVQLLFKRVSMRTLWYYLQPFRRTEWLTKLLRYSSGSQAIIYDYEL